VQLHARAFWQVEIGNEQVDLVVPWKTWVARSASPVLKTR